MLHGKRFFIPGTVELVKWKKIEDFKIIKEAADKADLLVKKEFSFENLPFSSIGLLLRYGLKNKLSPDYQRINKKYGDLPIAIEINTEILEWIDMNNPALLKDIYMIAILDALIHVGKKYNLTTEKIEEARSSYGAFPLSAEDLENQNKV